jgi:hypothetical protein
LDPVWLAAVCSDFSPSVPGSSCLAGDFPPHHGILGQICFCSPLLGLGLAEGFCFHSEAPVWGSISGCHCLFKYFLLCFDLRLLGDSPSRERSFSNLLIS